MRNDLDKNFRDISQENRASEEKKIDSFQIIMGLLLGAFFYFAYYMLMTEYFEKDPFKWPYILISIYFAIATILYPYSNNRASIWVENNKATNSLFTSKTVGLIAYIFAPIFFLIDKLS